MSQSVDTATAAPPVLDPSRSLDAAVDFFDDAVWHNARVCSHCFARIRDGIEGQVETMDGRLVVVDEDWQAPDGVLGEAHEEPPDSVASVQPLPKARTTCGECGSVGGAAHYDTLSKADAVDRAEPLADRLVEQGYAVDTDAIYAALRRIKSDDAHEAHDKEAFAVAAALGVAKA